MSGPSFDETLSVHPDPANATTLGAPESANRASAPRSVGSYELIEEIARGGMGVVFRARHTSLQRIVAVKMILAGPLAAPAALMRFRQEAEAAAHLDHPNILPIYEVGAHEGMPFFAMKLVEGGSLATRFDDFRSDLPAGVRALEQIARAVHYAHVRGILHRDLKPANILLDHDDTPYVADFGLAKRTGEIDSGLTQSGAILGTPSYMAPEQARSAAVTTASDTYSLGAMLYELLTGRPPFRGETIALTLRMLEEQEAVPPSRISSQCDPDLEAIALKCIEKEPSRRYESALAFAEDLSRWSRREPVTARRAGYVRRMRKWVRRNPVLTALFGVLVAGIAISTFFAIHALDQSNQKAEQARIADENARKARWAEEEAKDALCRSRFEEARALRLARQPGWRERNLELLRFAASLRQRTREGSEPHDLPELADLRSEAIQSLCGRDCTPVREIGVTITGNPFISGNGARLVQLIFQGELINLTTTDLNTGQELNQHRLEAKGLLGLIGVQGVDHSGERFLFVPDVDSLQLRSVQSNLALVAFTAPPARDNTFMPLCARMGRDGRRVALFRNNKDIVEAIVWDADKPNEPRVLTRMPVPTPEAHDIRTEYGPLSVWFQHIQFSPDSQWLAIPSASHKELRLFDAKDKDAQPRSIPFAGNVLASAWHPQRPLLAMLVAEPGSSPRLLYWDVQADRPREIADLRLTSLPRGLFAMAFSPKGDLLALSCGDMTIRLLDGETGRERFTFDTGFGLGFTQLSWTAGGQLITLAPLDKLRIWNLTLDLPITQFEGVKARRVPAFSQDGRWLAVYDATQTMAKEKLPDPKEKKPAAPAPDRVALFDLTKSGPPRFFDVPGDRNGRLHISPDGSQLLVATLPEIVVFETTTGNERFRYASTKGGPDALLNQAFFDPAGRLLLPLKTKEGAALWDVVGKKQAARLPLNPKNKEQFGFATPNAEGTYLMWGGMYISALKNDGQKLLRIIRTSDLAVIGDFDLASAPGSAEMAFPSMLSADATRLLSVHTPYVQGAAASLMNDSFWLVRDLPSGRERLRVPNRTMLDHVNTLSPDSRYLATANQHGSVDIWEIDTAKRCFRWQPFGGKNIESIRFTRQGDIVAVSEDGSPLTILRLSEIREHLRTMELDY